MLLRELREIGDRFLDVFKFSLFLAYLLQFQLQVKLPHVIIQTDAFNPKSLPCSHLALDNVVPHCIDHDIGCDPHVESLVFVELLFIITLLRNDDGILVLRASLDVQFAALLEIPDVWSDGDCFLESI